MEQRWIPIHAGPLWEMHLVQVRLVCEDIQSIIPHEIMKVMDPFYTGGAALLAELRVEKHHVKRALEIVRATRPESAASNNSNLDQFESGQADSIQLDEAQVAAEQEELAEQQLEKLASRTRWASLIGVTMPFGIYFGLRYIATCRKTKVVSRFHAMTLTAFVLALLITPVAIWIYWMLGSMVVDSIRSGFFS